MNKIQPIFSAFQKHNPEPKGELYYTNNFNLLVAVILSAQATDAGVNKVTKELFKKIQKPEDVMNRGLEQLTKEVSSIGLYKTKAANIMKMAEALIKNHASQVPNNVDDLVALAGVGRKTANVVLNIGFGQPTIAVDTHVFRVSNRLGLCTTKNPDETELALLKIIPEKFLKHAHHWLILHGRYICKAKKPDCGECFLREYCDFYNNNLEAKS